MNILCKQSGHPSVLVITQDMIKLHTLDGTLGTRVTVIAKANMSKHKQPALVGWKVRGCRGRFNISKEVTLTCRYYTQAEVSFKCQGYRYVKRKNKQSEELRCDIRIQINRSSEKYSRDEFLKSSQFGTGHYVLICVSTAGCIDGVTSYQRDTMELSWTFNGDECNSANNLKWKEKLHILCFNYKNNNIIWDNKYRKHEDTKQQHQLSG